LSGQSWRRRRRCVALGAVIRMRRWQRRRVFAELHRNPHVRQPVWHLEAGIQGGLAKQLEDETTIPTNDRELIRGRALFAR
jgi:hypothetical protein